jgi:hypothetical protein
MRIERALLGIVINGNAASTRSFSKDVNRL